MKNINIIETKNYLLSPLKLVGLETLLLFFLVFQLLTESEPYPYIFAIIIGAVSSVVLIFFKKPRLFVYLLILTMFVLKTLSFTASVSNGEQDENSTRDAAVEVTTQTLLEGENAWNRNPGVGVTTGPMSILLSIPFVMIFGEINYLSFVFWITLFLILLRNDIIHHNNTWLIFALFFLIGFLDFEHTLYWSLEEFYYPLIYLFFAYTLSNRKKWVIVGFLFSAAFLTRPNYLFLIAGFGLWLLFSRKITIKSFLFIVLGSLIGVIVILLPFIIIGKEDLLVNNPWKHAFDFSGNSWPDTNYAFHLLNKADAHFGPLFTRGFKVLGSILYLAGVVWAFKRFDFKHPFWHVAALSLFAHTFIWLPSRLHADYSLIITIPAMIAISLSSLGIDKQSLHSEVTNK